MQDQFYCAGIQGSGRAFLGYPELFGGPLFGPGYGYGSVVGVIDCVGWGGDLDQVQDLEASGAEQAQHVSVAQVELDAAIVGLPHIEAVHPHLRSHQAVLDRSSIWTAENGQGRISQKHQAASRTQQTRGLRNPLVRIRPDRRSVFGHRQVERGIREGYVLSRSFDEWEAETELLLAPTRSC